MVKSLQMKTRMNQRHGQYLAPARALIFDGGTSSLDRATVEQFAKSLNKLKGKVTLSFFAHQLPKGLRVGSLITLGPHGTGMQVVQMDSGEREGS